MAAAKELNASRERWLNPPEWTVEKILKFPGTVGGPWDRYIDPSTLNSQPASCVIRALSHGIKRPGPLVRPIQPECFIPCSQSLRTESATSRRCIWRPLANLSPAGRSLSAPAGSGMVGKPNSRNLVSLFRSTPCPPGMGQPSRPSESACPNRAETHRGAGLHTACAPCSSQYACPATGPCTDRWDNSFGTAHQSLEATELGDASS